jgi:putative membrane protein
VTGLKAYTDGVAQAADGASSLSAGASKLNLGATALQLIGTGNLKTQILGAEQAAAEKLLPYLEGTVPEAMRIWETIAQNAGKDGYDLRPEGMKTVTAYIIRTDLQ